MADQTTIGAPPVPQDGVARDPRTGHIPSKKGDLHPKGTGTIPAVENTTLTQVPTPDVLREQAGNPHAEPFGREMNNTPDAPKGVLHDPAIHPTQARSHTAQRIPKAGGLEDIETDADSSSASHDEMARGSAGTPALTKASVIPPAKP